MIIKNVTYSLKNTGFKGEYIPSGLRGRLLEVVGKHVARRFTGRKLHCIVLHCPCSRSPVGQWPGQLAVGGSS